MTGLVMRLERLEEAARIGHDRAGPYPNTSDDELTVMLLEAWANQLDAGCSETEQAELMAKAEAVKSDMARWSDYWRRDDVAVALPADFTAPLTGNGWGDRPEWKAQRDRLRSRAEAAFECIAAFGNQDGADEPANGDKSVPGVQEIQSDSHSEPLRV